MEGGALQQGSSSFPGPSASFFQWCKLESTLNFLSPGISKKVDVFWS
jgi:hypothetical protein